MTFQHDEFGDVGSGAEMKVRAPQCMACEEMLTDALDGSLGEVDQAWFDRHVSTCAECSGMLADAQRWAAWLELLKTPRPEPSGSLVARILAETSGAAAMPSRGVQAAGFSAHAPQMVPGLGPVMAPAVQPAKVLAFRPRLPKFAAWQLPRGGRFEPRLAMTAAMAFFSLALTLNLTGVRLNELRLSDLSPSNLRQMYYEANAEAVRYYDNLRVVRVLESRVDDLRQSNAEERGPVQTQPEQKRAPGDKPEETKEPKKPAGPGVSRRETPRMRSPRFELMDETTRRKGAPAGRTERGLV